MLASESLINIAPALSEAQAEVRAAFKSGENKFDKYSYAKYEDIAAAAKPVMAKHGLSVIFTADELLPLEGRVVGAQKDKIEHAVRVKVCARLLHKSGEWMESAAWGEGQDRADKAPYKAMTGAKKYLLAGLLAIPTTDDAEADEASGREHTPAPRAGQGNGQAPRQQSAPAAASSSGATTAGTKPSTSTTPAASATTEPTGADLKQAKANFDAFKRVEDIKRIGAAFKRAEGATSRDEALECISVIAGDGVTHPNQVPPEKVDALIRALEQLAGIEQEA